MKLKKVLSTVLALTMVCTLGTPVLAADSNEVFPHRYNSENGKFEMSKVSHPDKPANYRHAGSKISDGIVDYLGNGKIGIPGVDAGAEGQGSRGQTYSWASIAYGDYMYVNTLYDAAGNTEQLFGSAGGEDDYSSEIQAKLSECLFRGDIFLGEEDGKKAGCALVKINMKTGETKLVMSNEMTEDSYGNDYGGYYKHARGMDPQFRNAVELNDKLYFIGAPSGIPSIWEIDPNNDDAFRRVYADPQIVKNPGLIPKMIKEQKVCVAIRGMATFDGHLVISCVSADVNPYIAISKTEDPADGFVKIATTWEEDGTNSVEGELLGYPACHLSDSIYGGSIWEMVPFNGKLYVAICTGTQENKPTPDTMQSFAVIEGSYTGDITNRDNWTWTPVIGDKEDGAKYTFGIDPERTRSGACSLMPMGDYLYIGEYNDTEVAIIDMLTRKNPKFMADNLEEGVNLYRLDKNNQAELVVGDATETFPNGSLSGLKTGFGVDEKDHGNQYVWKMQPFQDKLYIGTFDESVVLHPLGQLSNGDLLEMTKEDWEEQLGYLKELIDALSKGKQPDAQEDVETDNKEEVKEEVKDADKDVSKEEVKDADKDAVKEEVKEEVNVTDKDAAKEEVKATDKEAKEEAKAADKKEVKEEVKEETKAADKKATKTTAEDAQVEMLQEMAEAGEEMEEALKDTEVDALALPQQFSEGRELGSEAELYQGMILVPYLLDKDKAWTTEESLTAQKNFISLYESLYGSYQNMKVNFPEEIQGIFDQLLTPETFEMLFHTGRLLKYLSTATEGFDMYVWDGNSMECITRDGFGDPYNSGLRVFAANDSKENPWLSIGTANLFYGTQIWRLEGEGLNLPVVDDNKPNPDKPDPENPDKPDPENPDNPDKPEVDDNKPGTDDKKPGTDNQKPGTDNQKPGTDNQKPGTDNQAETPETGDHANVGMWVAIIVVAGGLGAGAIFYKKKHNTSK